MSNGKHKPNCKSMDSHGSPLCGNGGLSSHSSTNRLVDRCTLPSKRTPWNVFVLKITSVAPMHQDDFWIGILKPLMHFGLLRNWCHGSPMDCDNANPHRVAIASRLWRTFTMIQMAMLKTEQEISSSGLIHGSIKMNVHVQPSKHRRHL